MMHLLKLSVGSESVDSLMAWQKTGRSHGPDGLPRHVTRMWPRREAEITAGGSIFCCNFRQFELFWFLFRGTNECLVLLPQLPSRSGI